MEIKKISDCFSAHRHVLDKAEIFVPRVAAMARICIRALQGGHKILLCGNGGSAADAQHIAAELVGRFHKERRALFALALTTDTSILTSVSNDYCYEDVFSRQVEGLGTAGDVLWCITTSGNSENILRAARLAKEKGLIVIASLGKDGGKMTKLSDEAFIVPDDSTARIQEMHLLAAHAICELIDDMDWEV